MEVIDIRIPDLGKTDKIELLKWYKRENDTFEKEDELCDLIVDKAAFTLEAPSAGKIKKIHIPEKSIVTVEQVAATIEV